MSNTTKTETTEDAETTALKRALFEGGIRAFLDEMDRLADQVKKEIEAGNP